ncbi:hypothetical protein B0H14DRAFT_1454513 [Mycena olivaceomarginata]|nr:hypothetical protein B0H14DRAFT_1454513 [Mycena olivaceomarginata]
MRLSFLVNDASHLLGFWASSESGVSMVCAPSARATMCVVSISSLIHQPTTALANSFLHPVSSGVLELTRVPPQSSCPASPSLSAAHSSYIHRQTQLYTGNRDPARPRSRFRPTCRRTSCARVRALLLLDPSRRSSTNRSPHPHPKRVFCVLPILTPSIRSEVFLASPYRYSSRSYPHRCTRPPHRRGTTPSHPR